MSVDDFGLKVSLEGYDVLTATPEQCAVHSSYPPLKAKLDQSPAHFGTVRVNFTSAVTQNVVHTLYEFNHGYTYKPLTIPSIVLTDPAFDDMSGVGQIAVGATLEIRAYATATKFIIDIYDDFSWITASSLLEVSFHLFAEEGS